jgi:hypothetical protein
MEARYMTTREPKRLTREQGYLVFPTVVPTDVQDLLDLMDHAAEEAGKGQGSGAPYFDHGMRLFNQLHAHFQIKSSHDLAQNGREPYLRGRG